MPSLHRAPRPWKTMERRVLPLLALLLGGCATTPASAPGAGGKVVDVGDFTVTAPAGDDWAVEVAAQAQEVTFTRRKIWFWTNGVLGVTTIKVMRNWVSPGAPLQDEEAEANRYLDHEEQDMMERGVKAGLYRLSDVRRETVTLEDRRYHVLRYKAIQPRGALSPDLVQDAALWLHYPADFGETRVFYLFLIADSMESGSATTNDTARIEPVVRSFRLKR